MDCDDYLISCQLERIANEMAGSDAYTFWSTLIATLVGAAVALLGTWWLDRNRAQAEANRLYERDLNEAMYRVLEEASARMHLLATDASKPLPPPVALDVAASMSRMVSRGDDAKATKQMQLALSRIRDLDEIDDQRRDTRVITQIVRAWREGSTDASKAEERFRGLANSAETSS